MHYKDCEIHKLDVNYRRRMQTIVGASNEVINIIKPNQQEVRAFNEMPSKIQIYRAKKEDDGVEF
jgi:hypothetical protein